MSDMGHRDAAEILSEKYIYMCRDIDEDPFPGILDMDLFTEYLLRIVPDEAVQEFMVDDFSQGFLIGRVVSTMMSDFTSQLEVEMWDDDKDYEAED